MKINAKKLIKILGLSLMITSVILVYALFFMAYLGNKKVTININAIGEANLEAILLVICVPCVIYCIRKYINIIN